MTTLNATTLTLQGADLGPENPLPPLGTLGEVQNIPAGPGVPESMKQNMVYGHRPNPLPYTVQDGYTRSKSTKRLKALVLENEFLAATFLPEYGGRLWSLRDKVTGRDLVYENPVFQPANLAIRNAWLSGGVEWNIGLRGHSPFTCSNVFAARVNGSDGEPVLRMYEYERIRQVPYLIDFHLPSDSRLLYVFVRITNPHEETIPMYWWSNIAFPEDPQTRVVVPAERAYRFGYGKRGLFLRDIPETDGMDVTYSVNLGHSADFFFDIPQEQQKWIAAVDSTGAGLFQTSTDRLLGRKLFVWGTGPGGNAWQQFLSVPGKPYIEIQAGLAHTQMEHIPMPAGSEWSWIEAYGPVNADPAIVHGDSWKDACSAVGSVIEEQAPRGQLAKLHEEAERVSRLPTAEQLNAGSEWGALEASYRARLGRSPMVGLELDFGSVMAAPQQQWFDLLEDGIFPEPDPLTEPVGYEVETKWRDLLEKYAELHTDSWYAHLHLGLMRFNDGDIDGATQSWRASVAAAANPWAYRNLAQLAMLQSKWKEAADLYASAFEMTETCTPLTVEYGRALLAANRAEQWLELHSRLPDATRESGRLQLLYAQALLAAGRLDEALAVVEAEPEVTDLREGENSLTDVWYQIHEKRLAENGATPEGDLRAYVQEHFPPPSRIDFRMRTKTTED
jgi:hypothetical protein